MIVKKILQNALLSVGLVSAGHTMKMGEFFEIDVVVQLGEDTFSSDVRSFPKGNHMRAQDVCAELAQLGRKTYNEALRTVHTNDAYTQNREPPFQRIKEWMDKFTEFAFSDKAGSHFAKTLMHRSKPCFSNQNNVTLKEFCAFRTTDLKTGEADDIVLIARISCFYE